MHLRHPRLPRRMRGVAALEFALVAPLLFLAIFAIVELFLLIMTDVMLESSVRRLGRDALYNWPEPASYQELHGRILESLEDVPGSALSVTCRPVSAGATNCASARQAGLLLYTISIQPPTFTRLASPGTFTRTTLVRNAP